MDKIFHFSAFVDIYRRDSGQWMDSGVHYIKRKLYMYPVAF